MGRPHVAQLRSPEFEMFPQLKGARTLVRRKVRRRANWRNGKAARGSAAFFWIRNVPAIERSADFSPQQLRNLRSPAFEDDALLGVRGRSCGLKSALLKEGMPNAPACFRLSKFEFYVRLVLG